MGPLHFVPQKVPSLEPQVISLVVGHFDPHPPNGLAPVAFAFTFVNSLLLLVSVEFALEDYIHDAPDAVFTRLGAIYSDRVKLAVRYPHHKSPIHVVWRKVHEPPDP